MFNFCKKNGKTITLPFFENIDNFKKKKKFSSSIMFFNSLQKTCKTISLAVFSRKSLFRLIIFFHQFQKNEKIINFFHRQNVQFLQKTARLLPCRFFGISTISKKKNFFIFKMFSILCKKRARLLPCRFFRISTISKKKFFFHRQNVQFLQKTARLLPCRFFRISTILKMKKNFFQSSKCSILCKKRARLLALPFLRKNHYFD